MSLRIALLGLLTDKGPSSGYDLAKLFDQSLNHVWQAGHSQIYPELVKMAADGLITSGAEGARGRKTYSITPEGAETLRTWMLRHEPAMTIRSESALQAFLLPLLDKEDAISLLRRLQDRYRDRLRYLLPLDGGGHGRHFGSYALDLGIRQVRSVLDWCEDTIADLQSTDARSSADEQGLGDPSCGPERQRGVSDHSTGQEFMDSPRRDAR